MHRHVLLPQVVTALDHEASDLVGGDVSPDRFSLYCLFCLTPLGAEVGLGENESLALFGERLLLVVWLLAALDLEGIFEADCLDDELEWDSFFGAEGKALINQDIDSYARIQTDGETDSIQVVCLMTQEFLRNFIKILPQLIVPLAFLILLQFLR